MEDKLHNFFSENEFDFHEPHSGHMQRFEKRLQGIQPKKRASWRWMSVAASIILALGFYIGYQAQPEAPSLSSVSSEMAEAEAYFVNTINVEIQELEKSRSLETEKVIEKALEKIEKLEDDYRLFIEELKKNGEQRRVIHAMIQNYQKRLEILQNTLIQIEIIKNPNTVNDEIYL
jgi:hypothetical protein